jgi:thiamine biosynthesis lipoprotein ApbE
MENSLPTKLLNMGAIALVGALILSGCSSGQIARSNDTVATHTTTTTVTSAGTTVVKNDLRITNVIEALDQKTFTVKLVKETWSGTWRFDFARGATNVISTSGNARFKLEAQENSFCHTADVPAGSTAGGCFTVTEDPDTTGGLVIAKDGKAYARLSPA